MDKQIMRLFLLLALFIQIYGCGETDPLSNSILRLETATPESQNLDSDALDRLGRDFESTFGGVINNSLLIARNGYLVYEQYFHGVDANDIHTMYSVTKSITSLLIGIAFDQHLVDSLDTPLPTLFPEYQPMQNAANGKNDMTLRHILQMRTGIEWDEHSTPYTSAQNPTTALVNSPDWIRFMLDLPLSSQPGMVYRYNSGATILLAGVLKNKTGLSANQFAENHLFSKLGIDNYRWDSGNPNGISNTGWGLHLRPRDMVRIGLLVLNKGEWFGEQIVSKEWIESSSRRHSSFASGRGYGYQWVIGPDVQVGENTYESFSANGWGGQRIIVIPELSMVVVTTAMNFSSTNWSTLEILERVAAAFIDKSSK
ncbi:beta-lactamase family protein [bacterium]|nr:beta-lactamase family protein [bacterium]